MTRSSLTEATPATPGWVDAKIRAIFQPLGEAGIRVGDAYADCLAGVRSVPDVDQGRDRCRAVAIRELGAFVEDTAALDRTLQALEAEIASAT